VIYAAWQYIDPASVLQQKMTAHATALQEHGRLLREIQRQQSAMHDEFSKCHASLSSTPHRLQSASVCHLRERSFGGRIPKVVGVPAGCREDAEQTAGAVAVDSAARGDHIGKSAATAAYEKSSMSYRELQSELKRRGLKAQGNMQALRLRLLQSSALGDAME
jgi:hypothetical protein